MRNKLLIVPILLLAVVFGVTSCTETTKNDIQEYIGGFTVGAYLREATVFNGTTGAFSATGNLGNTFDFGNLAGSSIGKRVRPWGSPISRVNVYVVKGQNNNQTAWKLVKSYTRNPTDTSYFDIRVTAQEIATALTLPLDQTTFNLGSVFTCYTEVITSDNKKFTINNTNADVTAAGSFYFAIFNFSGSVVCPFVPASMAGNYRVVADEWEDWAVGDILTNVVVNATSNSMGIQNVFPNPAFGGNTPSPILVNINPTTGAATVTNSTYGRYGTTTVAVTSQGSANFVLACTGNIKLLLRHHVPNNVNLVYGAAGGYLLELQKQ
jgi:hypothetical protein